MASTDPFKLLSHFFSVISRLLIRHTCCLLLALLMVSCSNENNEQTTKEIIVEQVKANERLVITLEKIETSGDIETVWPEIVELNKTIEGLTGKAARLPRPDAKLLSSMKSEMERLQLAKEKQRTEIRRIVDLPGGKALTDRLERLRLIGN